MIKACRANINKPVVFHIAQSGISKKLAALLEKAKSLSIPRLKGQ